MTLLELDSLIGDVTSPANHAFPTVFMQGCDVTLPVDWSDVGLANGFVHLEVETGFPPFPVLERWLAEW